MFDSAAKAKDETIAALSNQVTILRELLSIEQERVNRLTEALAAKSGVPLAMPQPELQNSVSEPAPLDGWWKANCSGGAISSPVREVEVPAPTKP